MLRLAYRLKLYMLGLCDVCLLQNGRECMAQVPCQPLWAAALAQRRAWQQQKQQRTWGIHPEVPLRLETWAAGECGTIQSMPWATSELP